MKAPSGKNKGDDAVREALEEGASTVQADGQEDDPEAAPAAPEAPEENQQEPEENLQQEIERATGQTAGDILRKDPAQIMAELMNHTEGSMAAQEGEIGRLSALRDEVKGQQALYSKWQEHIAGLQENAAKVEEQIRSGLRAARLAKALLDSDRD